MECLNYPIYFQESFETLTDAFIAAGLTDRRVCLITDQNVAGLYLKEVQKIIPGESFIIPPGEENKNLDTISRIYEFFLRTHMDRRSVAIALGGGVVGDMTGFAAATFMRGISFVQIPTTLLSQVDASVGGKTGVDFDGHKNLIGAFCQPAFVYINVNTLETLPPGQFASGMGEAIKHGLIADPGYYAMLTHKKEAIKSGQKAALLDVVSGSCRIKANVVTEDERENGVREILNFGHTFGHAIESLSGFTLTHGSCVALGMTAAAYLSCKRGYIKEEILNALQDLLKYYDLPVRVHNFDPGEILAQMAFDKKNKEGRIRLVLLESPGKAIPNQTADNGSILEAIRFITEKHEGD